MYIFECPRCGNWKYHPIPEKREDEVKCPCGGSMYLILARNPKLDPTKEVSEDALSMSEG